VLAPHPAQRWSRAPATGPGGRGVGDLTGRIVWVASYPKSGNTWLRVVYASWRRGDQIALNDLSAGLIATRAVFDDALGIPSSSLNADEVDLLRPRVDEVVAADADGVCLRKIHDVYLRDGGPIVSLQATRAALYFIRDPRDVAVSYAHRAGRDLEWAQRRLADPDACIAAGDGALNEQVRQRLDTWSAHVRSWVDKTPFPVEVVRYEDCVADPLATFTRALEFTQVGPVERDQVARALETASFDRLREAEDDQGFDEPGAPRFFRRGEPGAWRDELPAELAARIERDHSEVMARFGYLPEA
jgi:aryl sulfotransferase